MNPRSLRRAAALVLAVSASAAGAAPALSAGTAASARTLRLTIAFTGDVSGYLEPCG